MRKISPAEAIAAGWFSPNSADGFCECGCGERAPVARYSSREKGWVGGEPQHFVSGHNARGMQKSATTRRKISESKRGARNPSWKGDAVGYAGLHSWLERSFGKRGICEKCGARRYTEWANISGEYLRDRADFTELCRPCHWKFGEDTHGCLIPTFRRTGRPIFSR